MVGTWLATLCSVAQQPGALPNQEEKEAEVDAAAAAAATALTAMQRQEACARATLVVEERACFKQLVEQRRGKLPIPETAADRLERWQRGWERREAAAREWRRRQGAECAATPSLSSELVLPPMPPSPWASRAGAASDPDDPLPAQAAAARDESPDCDRLAPPPPSPPEESSSASTSSAAGAVFLDTAARGSSEEEAELLGRERLWRIGVWVEERACFVDLLGRFARREGLAEIDAEHQRLLQQQAREAQEVERRAEARTSVERRAQAAAAGAAAERQRLIALEQLRVVELKRTHRLERRAVEETEGAHRTWFLAAWDRVWGELLLRNGHMVARAVVEEEEAARCVLRGAESALWGVLHRAAVTVTAARTLSDTLHAALSDELQLAMEAASRVRVRLSEGTRTLAAPMPELHGGARENLPRSQGAATRRNHLAAIAASLGGSARDEALRVAEETVRVNALFALMTPLPTPRVPRPPSTPAEVVEARLEAALASDLVDVLLLTALEKRAADLEGFRRPNPFDSDRLTQ